MRPVILSDVAEAELEEAFHWYAERNTPAARRFIEHIEATLSLVGESPERFRPLSTGVRRARIPGFPYSLYFVVHPSLIDVVSVLHGARDPRI